MPKRKRTEAARKGWKKRSNKEREVKLWNDSSMIEAMEAVKAGRLGVNRAAEEYNVQKTTYIWTKLGCLWTTNSQSALPLRV